MKSSYNIIFSYKLTFSYKLFEQVCLLLCILEEINWILKNSNLNLLSWDHVNENWGTPSTMVPLANQLAFSNFRAEEHCGWYVRVCKQKPRFRGRTYFNKMFFGPHTKLPCIIYSIAELNILENEYWSFDVAKLDGQSILMKKEIKWALFTSHSGYVVATSL